MSKCKYCEKNYYYNFSTSDDMYSSHLENVCKYCYGNLIDEFKKTKEYLDIKYSNEYPYFGNSPNLFDAFIVKKIREDKINEILS